MLDMQKKTGMDVKESPSKSSKINMKYISSYPDVGPQVANAPITYNDLVEMGKVLDKKELWVRSDLRLIFAIEDSQAVDETIEMLNKIISGQQ